MATSYCKVCMYTSWVAHDRNGGDDIHNDSDTTQRVATYDIRLSYEMFVMPHSIAHRRFIERRKMALAPSSI